MSIFKHSTRLCAVELLCPLRLCRRVLAEFYEYIEDNRFPEAWDAEDIFEHPFLVRHGKLAAAAALPTMKMATELFSIENLRHVAKVGFANVLYAPWSESLMIVPYEIRIGLL